jgi:hypothetical protein
MTDRHVIEKMKVYSALAEKTIALQKVKCQALQDEVEVCRGLIQSLRFNLSEAHAEIKLQDNVERISQFSLKRLESGGTREVRLQRNLNKEFECTTIKACDRSEACYQFLSDCDTNEIVITECHMERPLNVLQHHTKGVHNVYEVLLSKVDPCPSPERADTSTNGEPPVEVDIAQTMGDVWSRVSETDLFCAFCTAP